MVSRVHLVGGNLVADTEFRKRLSGRDASTEVQMVLEDLVASWPESTGGNESESQLTVEKEEAVANNDHEREQLKISLKIFLRDFRDESLASAVEAALNKLNMNQVDLLLLAVPLEAAPVIGIGCGESGDDQRSAFTSFLSVWSSVERLVEAGKVKEAGVCDLHPPLFISLYEQATVKPSSVQVNLKSCCVVPEELSTFAKTNKLSLLTHSDPMELVPDDFLRKLLYPHLGREAGHFTSDWIARYLVQVKDRGVMLEKRYLIQLAK